jgi:hypothetical protein
LRGKTNHEGSGRALCIVRDVFGENEHSAAVVDLKKLDDADAVTHPKAQFRNLGVRGLLEHIDLTAVVIVDRGYVSGG